MQNITSPSGAIRGDEIKILKQKLFEKYYEKLNLKQRQAVTTVSGSVLVLAGAGSGKTTVLVNRIGHLLTYGTAFDSNFIPQSADVTEMQRLFESGSRTEIGEYLKRFAVDVPRPWQILCITFTNKAAKEFKERLKKLLGEDAEEIWAGTFHSICVRILRRYIAKIGFSNNFSIYDSDDSKKLITACMKTLRIADDKLPIRSIQNDISRSKEKFITPEAFEIDAGSDFRKKQIAKIYKEYQKELKKASALDFDDIIFNTILLFAAHPDVLQSYKEQFKYILADEYQDTNNTQSMLIEMLGIDRGNVCVVGDDDQSIYAFRGATIENILNFDRVFTTAKVIRLEQNYRSTKTILNAANGLIENNKGRKGKTLWTENNDGDKIIVKCHETQREEAQYIVDFIRRRVADGDAKYSDFAILYRLNEQSNALEYAFSKSYMPYRIFGGLRFYDRKEIKDIVAYLCVVSNPNDDTRLRRIINLPKRNIGPVALDVLADVATNEGKSLYETLQNADNNPALVKFLAPFKNFVSLIEQLRYMANNMPLGDFVKGVIDKTGYRQMLADSPTEADRLQNVEELISSAITYEENSETKSLSSFLEEIALVSDLDNYDTGSDSVAMMTMHSAKGLEFPIVFLPGFEDGVFPSMQSITSGDLEEERRLAYVGLTRAKSELVITHTKSRLLYGRTTANPISRFASEIPEQYAIFEEADRVENWRTAVPKTGNSYSNKYVSSPFNQQQSAPKQPQKVQPKTIKPEFKEGDRVLHGGFGEGLITGVEVMGPDVIYTVEFDSQGKRKLMASYAKLKKVDS